MKLVRAGLWAPLLVLALHFIVFPPLDAYAVVRSLDSYEHVAGGIAVAFCVWRVLGMTAAPALGALARLGRIVLTATTVLSAVVVWEFVEWGTDRLGWTVAQVTLGDTLLDMALGAGGGLATVGIAAALDFTRAMGRDA